MKRFDVYRHPDKKGGTRGRTTFWGSREIEVIKNGFSWPGFFFGPVWALAKRLYPHAAVLIVIYVALIAAPLHDWIAISSEIAVRVLVGLMGNDWRRRELARHGFRLEETVECATDGEALASFLARIIHE